MVAAAAPGCPPPPRPLGNLPMPSRVLITGGAGFIGSHVTDELLRHDFQVRLLDCLCPQVHSNQQLTVENGRFASKLGLLANRLPDRETT